MNYPTMQVERTGKLEKLVETALQIGAGAIDVVAVSPSDISAEEDLVNFCREPRCGYYGQSGNCPPNVLGPSRFRDLLNNCEQVLAVKMDVPLGCLLTDERFVILKLLHEIVADIEKSAIELGYSNSKTFAGGPCKVIFCHEHGHCNVLDGGECRNPEYARPSIEANGVNVNKLKKTAGWYTKRDTNQAVTDPVMEAVYGLVLIIK